MGYKIDLTPNYMDIPGTPFYHALKGIRRCTVSRPFQCSRETECATRSSGDAAQAWALIGRTARLLRTCWLHFRRVPASGCIAALGVALTPDALGASVARCDARIAV